jgi:DNA-binding beta-propeller fold protein YncE
VTSIDTATNTPDTPIPVATSPWGIAITPDGTTAYVTNFDDGTVTPIGSTAD